MEQIGQKSRKPYVINGKSLTWNDATLVSDGDGHSWFVHRDDAKELSSLLEEYESLANLASSNEADWKRESEIEDIIMTKFGNHIGQEPNSFKEQNIPKS